MRAPLYSTVSLVTELFVSAAVYSAIFQGWRKNVFRKGLIAFALAYETLFNISYMSYRAATHHATEKHPGWLIALAVFHGTLSLAMFIALVAFMVAAWKGYARGVNFFKKHRALTIVFLALWTASILSGVAFYFAEYLRA